MPGALTLKPEGRKPLDLGEKVPVKTVHLNPPGDEAGLAAVVNGSGLRDWDKDGLLEHDTALTNMWCGACPADLKLEFAFAEAVPLGAVEVWNYNAEWQTTNGVRKVDVAVSTDGTTWKTVLAGVEFAQSEGRPDYDDPVVLRLPVVTAFKVRFENIQPWGTGQVGLSEVIFHRAGGSQASPVPKDERRAGGAL